MLRAVLRVLREIQALEVHNVSRTNCRFNPAREGHLIDNPLDGTLVDVVSCLRTRALSSRELTEACLARIAERDNELEAWERVYDEDALREAEQADERLSASSVQELGLPHPLCGVPIGLKDVLPIRGKLLTGGSRALQDNVCQEDADVVRRLRDAGVVLLGHTKSQEFAAGRSPQTSANPWNAAYSPGGSSNGSGSAVGGRTILAALGTDTAGSIRRPASACGLSTVMGTYGSVSNGGIISTATTLTQIGPLTATAMDAALVFSALTGSDRYDPYTPDAGVSPSLESGRIESTPTSKPFKGRRIGVLGDFKDETVTAVGDLFDAFVNDLVALGVDLVQIEAPAPCPSDLYPRPELVAFHRDLYPERGHLYSSYQRRMVADSLRKCLRWGY